MNRYLLLVSFYVLPLTLAAQDWRWIAKGGSMDQNPSNPQEEEVADMATDPNGNVYVLSLVNQGGANVGGLNKQTYGNADWMVASFKCDGSLRWAKVIGGPKDDYPQAIRTDGLGGVYIAGMMSLDGGGSFVGNIDADATIPQGNKTMYLVKYDTAGNYQWYRAPQADTVTYASMISTGVLDMSVEANGTVHCFCQLPKGVFGGVGGFVANNLGDYMLKYDAAGNFQGGLKLEMLLGGSTIASVKMARDDKAARYYVAGQWLNTTGNIQIGTNTLTGSMYVACFDNTGQVVWYRQNTDDNSSMPGFEGRPALDESGNIYLAGHGHTAGPTSSATVFNGYTFTGGTLHQRPFIVALNPDGNSIWATSTSDASATGWARYVGLRNSGEVWAISSFTGTIKWPYYNTTYNLPGANYKILVTRFNTQTGKVLGLDTVVGGGMTKVYPTAIAATRDNVFIGGKFEGTITKGGNTVTKTGGVYDWFVTKYGYNCNCSNIPEPKFTFTRVGAKQVNFTYTGSGQTSLDWDFGDGTTSTQTSPSHNYAQNSFYQTCVTVSNSCGDNIHCQNIFLWPVGTEEVVTETAEIKIYPNPANDYLYIEGAEAGMKLSVQNTLGQTLYSGTVSSSKEVINISQLVPGNYVLTLTGNDGGRNVVKLQKL